MKLKLAGLLLFSAAADCIDKSNYVHHLCDEGIFKEVPRASESLPSYTKDTMEAAIKGHYQYYCYVRHYYDVAVENKKKSLGLSQKPCGDNPKDFQFPAQCVEKQGMEYARACETLKQDRDSMPSAWNSFVSKRVSCNNM